MQGEASWENRRFAVDQVRKNTGQILKKAVTAEIAKGGIRKRERHGCWIEFEDGMGRLAQGSEIIQGFTLDRWKVSPGLVTL